LILQSCLIGGLSIAHGRFPSDGDQVEEESEAQAQELQGRITRSKAKVLGKEHQMLSLFVITLV